MTHHDKVQAMIDEAFAPGEPKDMDVLVPRVLDRKSPEVVVGALDYVFSISGIRSEVEAAYLQV